MNWPKNLGEGDIKELHHFLFLKNSFSNGFNIDKIY